MGFGSQWRDLLDDAHDEVTKHGFQSQTLPPGGHKIPVVNGCLVYVWRVPGSPDAVSKFAASPTRQSGFTGAPPPDMLFEPTFADEGESTEEHLESAETETMLEAVHGRMPLVLVTIWSTPRHMKSVEWAVADLDEAGKVTLHGQECIWELVAADAGSDVESFDSDTPVPAAVEPRRQEGTDPDARRHSEPV